MTGASPDFALVLDAVRRMIAHRELPIVTAMAETGTVPFRILVATLLSLRTRDETTAAASARLFARADTAIGLIALGEEEIARLVYPVGFYRRKARQLVEICRRLLDGHAGLVPNDLTQLLALPGVGRKTANLVLTKGFGLPGICVDTHVHRISNRLGWVRTRTPEETELALRRTLPREHWLEINDLLVGFGQSLCGPLSPRCTECELKNVCPRHGVRRHR